MTSDLDIYRAANELIHHYGDEAAIHAAMRADSLAEKDDLDGYNGCSSNAFSRRSF
jgi:hypothetical protein